MISLSLRVFGINLFLIKLSLSKEDLIFIFEQKGLIALFISFTITLLIS